MDALIKKEYVARCYLCVQRCSGYWCFQRIKEAGYKIPNDIAVMGFSNNKITTLVDPQLTTVDQPSFEMGRKAAKILIQTIEKEITKPCHLVLGTKLIIRGST